MSRNGRSAALLRWLPAIGLVAALFVVPSSSTGVARLATLNVTPGAGSYGGQQVTFSGDMGVQQRIWLQRRGTPGAAWAEVVDPRTGKAFTIVTQADGSFSFKFPAPAMNFVYFRLHGQQSDTDQHLFTSKHQDAEISVFEHSEAETGPLPQATGVGTTVDGEPFSLNVDTAFLNDSDRKRPILAGRAVTLERRTISGDDVRWGTVATGSIGRDGKLSFGAFAPGGALAQTPGDYRVRLENWTTGGDKVGWFVSFPFDLRVVDRPKQVLRLAATALPDGYRVNLKWELPSDPRRAKIIIARGTNNPPGLRQVIATLPAGATSYLDNTVYPQQTYHYAVYTQASDGVYVRVPVRDSVTTPAPPAPRGEG